METIGVAQAASRVGLIGYGLAGRAFHAPFIAATPGLALAAIVSRDAAKVQADWPDVRVVPDVGSLLANGSIDLVVVASPDHLHAEHAIAALEAGRHVLVDKPLAPTLAAARAMAERAEAVGRILCVFHNRRWDADFRTLRALVAAGTLGRIVELESRFDRHRPDPGPGWKEARGAGIWQDLGPHLIDQALQLFGRPQAIMCDLATMRDGGGAPDHVHATLRYDRLRVILHAGKIAPDGDLRFAVHGTGASFVKHGTDPQEAAAVAGERPGGAGWGVDPRPGMLTRIMPDGTTVREAVTGVPGDYGQLYRALATAIRGEGPNPVPAADALAVMELLDAGVRSAAARREIELG